MSVNASILKHVSLLGNEDSTELLFKDKNNLRKIMQKVAWIVDYGDEHYGKMDILFFDESQFINENFEPEDFEFIERIPYLDKFAEKGWVPLIILLSGIGKLSQYNWTVFCNFCEMEFDDEFWDYSEDKEIDPIFVGTTHVFCCKECRNNWFSSRNLTRQLLE